MGIIVDLWQIWARSFPYFFSQLAKVSGMMVTSQVWGQLNCSGWFHSQKCIGWFCQAKQDVSFPLSSLPPHSNSLFHSFLSLKNSQDKNVTKYPKKDKESAIRIFILKFYFIILYNNHREIHMSYILTVNFGYLWFDPFLNNASSLGTGETQKQYCQLE